MKVLVVADGDVPLRGALDETWPGWSDRVALVVAADGGALGARRLGLTVDLLVGDMDSLSPSELETVARGGAAVERAAVDKDESDAELAILAALRRGATEIVVLGALGGPRFDHTLANVGLLGMPSLGAADLVLLDARTRVGAISAPGPGGAPLRRSLAGRIGDTVSLLPLGCDVEGVATEGLRYALTGETLRAGPARGLSNVRISPDAAVTVGRGFLVIVESPAWAAEARRGAQGGPAAEAEPDAAAGPDSAAGPSGEARSRAGC